MNRAALSDLSGLDAEAQQAFEAHAAMMKAEAADPVLRANPFWQALRDTAFARFQAFYEKVPAK